MHFSLIAYDLFYGFAYTQCLYGKNFRFTQSIHFDLVFNIMNAERNLLTIFTIISNKFENLNISKFRFSDWAKFAGFVYIRIILFLNQYSWWIQISFRFKPYLIEIHIGNVLYYQVASCWDLYCVLIKSYFYKWFKRFQS